MGALLTTSAAAITMCLVDEMNLRLSSIAQRMTMALQLIPIQKAKAADMKLVSRPPYCTSSQQ